MYRPADTTAGSLQRRYLVQVALGKKPADLVFRRGRLVNVHTAEIIDGVDVAVAAGEIALVGEAGHTIGSQTLVVDARGYYLAPGFLDGHVHVESSMVTLTQFARAVIPHGTVGIFMDPHEIANVLGLAGVRLLHQEGQGLPLRVFTTVPSCVPAAPGLEDAGGAIGPAEVAEALDWKGVVALGEMMNYDGVLKGDSRVYEILEASLSRNKVLTGHFPLPAEGPEMAAYRAAGITSCHESVLKDEALAKARLGICAQLREGSAWQDIKETVKALTETNIDSRCFQLVSDDVHPETLMELGHMNHVVVRAIEEGLKPATAIQMATLNTAQYYGLAQSLGSIAPGKKADILMLKDLASVEVERVYINGTLAAEKGQIKIPLPSFTYPLSARRTLRLRTLPEPHDFTIKAPINQGEARVRVIRVQEGKSNTASVERALPVTGGILQIPPGKDLAKIAVFERHKGTGGAALGLVEGFGFRRGAVASTVAHDSHNLLVVGVNDTDMAFAARVLVEEGGGMVAVAGEKVLALVPLPVAGLLSPCPVEEVRGKVASLAAAWRCLGSELASGFMTMALLSLPVIPALRITNRGLVDVETFTLVDLFLDC